MTTLSIHVPLPSPNPQLLEIANDIATIVEKKKDVDMTVTYIIFKHNFWCSTLVFNTYRTEFAVEWEALVQRLKADKKEEKEQESRNWKWWFHLQLWVTYYTGVKDKWQALAFIVHLTEERIWKLKETAIVSNVVSIRDSLQADGRQSIV